MLNCFHAMALWNAVWRVLCCFTFGQPTIRFPPFRNNTWKSIECSSQCVVYLQCCNARSRVQEDYWKLIESLELIFLIRFAHSKTKTLSKNCNRCTLYNDIIREKSVSNSQFYEYGCLYVRQLNGDNKFATVVNKRNGMFQYSHQLPMQ